MQNKLTAFSETGTTVLPFKNMDRYMTLIRGIKSSFLLLPQESKITCVGWSEMWYGEEKQNIHKGRSRKTDEWKYQQCDTRNVGFLHKACRKSTRRGLLKINQMWQNIRANNYQFTTPQQEIQRPCAAAADDDNEPLAVPLD